MNIDLSTDKRTNIIKGIHSALLDAVRESRVLSFRPEYMALRMHLESALAITTTEVLTETILSNEKTDEMKLSILTYEVNSIKEYKEN